MMENRDKDRFSYSYSAKEQEEIRRIRSRYTAKSEEEDKLVRLRRLDESVTRRATVVSLILGILGALLLGFGMSLVMSELGAEMGLRPIHSVIIGVVLGALGIAPIGLAYPVYQILVKRGRARIAPEVLRLSDELLQ